MLRDSDLVKEKKKMVNEEASGEKSFRIKEEGGLFSRLVTKESSTLNSSSRVWYHGEASMGVPFRWESKPGTPKHPLSHSSLPPLTPPPSYNSCSIKNPTNYSISKKPHLISRYLRALLSGSRKVHMSPSSSSSSSFSTRHDFDEGLGSPASTLGVALKKRKDGNDGVRGCNPFGN